MRIGLLLLLPVVAVTLSGCQRIFASTDAEFAAVDVKCVDAAIRQTPGVIGPSYHLGNEDAPRALSHWWSYGEKEPAFVVLRYDGKSWTYRNIAMQRGGPWSSHELEKLSPVAARVNATIASRCGLAIPKEVTINVD